MNITKCPKQMEVLPYYLAHITKNKISVKQIIKVSMKHFKLWLLMIYSVDREKHNDFSCVYGCLAAQLNAKRGA